MAKRVTQTVEFSFPAMFSFGDLVPWGHMKARFSGRIVADKFCADRLVRVIESSVSMRSAKAEEAERLATVKRWDEEAEAKKKREADEQIARLWARCAGLMARTIPASL